MNDVSNTIVLNKPVYITSYACVGGKKEGEGPLKHKFDLICPDNSLGYTQWEKAESEIIKKALQIALQKANMNEEQLNAIISGDLQNQCTATHFAMRDFNVPLIGIYGACSTMAQGLAMGAIFASGGELKAVAAISSSHFCAAERQYRTPLVYGVKRTPTAQWTVTGAGCVIIKDEYEYSAAHIKSVTFGNVVDLGVKDITNMGAAMAPAAASTIMRHLKNTNTKPLDYDVIYTGDLGAVGTELLHKILEKENIALLNHKDCGLIIYDRQNQNVMAGGSGAACSACVLCAEILPKLAAKKLKRILFISTGALMSQTTFLQGESIPAIAHLVEIAI